MDQKFRILLCHPDPAMLTRIRESLGNENLSLTLHGHEADAHSEGNNYDLILSGPGDAVVSTEALRRAYPGTPLVMLSAYDEVLAGNALPGELQSALDNIRERRKLRQRIDEAAMISLGRGSSIAGLAERALAASNASVLISDATGHERNIVYVNPAFEKLSGYSAAELTGRSWRDLVLSVSDEQYTLDQLDTSYRDRVECRVIVRRKKRSGEVYWSEVILSPIREPDGSVGHMLEISMDVTERIELLRTLKVSGGHAGSSAVLSPAGSRQPAAGPLVEDGTGQTILLIEEDRIIRDIIQLTLEKFGYRVIAVGDGAEAVPLFADSRREIAAVIADIKPPFADGTATVRSLQELDPHVRVIAISGVTDRNRIAELKQLGVKAFLQKPFKPDLLLGALRKILAE